MSKLSYKETGSGSVIVFLHGFCEAKEVWESSHARLSGKYKIISIDFPGSGQSETVLDLTIDLMAEQVFELLKSLKIDKYIVVGHSMGGYVSLALAEKHPDSLAGLCLFHSTAYPDSEEKKQQRNKTLNYLNEHGVEAFIRPFVPPLFYPQNRVACENAIQALIEMGCKVPLPIIASCVASMRDRPDRTHILMEAKFPVLFIIGKNDTSIKMEDAIAQSQLPANSYIQLLENTAHQGIYERENETINMLNAFGGIVFSLFVFYFQTYS
jgi:pimeloyl-ACP methyl ester carboxylesterase